MATGNVAEQLMADEIPRRHALVDSYKSLTTMINFAVAEADALGLSYTSIILRLAKESVYDSKNRGYDPKGQ